MATQAADHATIEGQKQKYTDPEITIGIKTASKGCGAGEVPEIFYSNLEVPTQPLPRALSI